MVVVWEEEGFIHHANLNTLMSFFLYSLFSLDGEILLVCE